jgi:transketolase
MFYDSNDIQLSTETKAVTIEDTAMKYRSWGWEALTIDGNNQDEIRKALKDANQSKEKPVIIIGKTIMGKGLLDSEGNSFERKTSTHGMPVSEAGGSFEKSLVNLGGDVTNPFGVFDEVKALYAKVLEARKKEAAEWKHKKSEWASKNSELSNKLTAFFSGTLPEIDFRAIPQKEGSATRAASAAVLCVLAHKVENMVVASADLSKTPGPFPEMISQEHFSRLEFPS